MNGMLDIVAISSPGRLLADAGFWSAFANTVDWLTQPQIFITLVAVLLVSLLILYRQWTRPGIAAVLFAGFCIFYFGSVFNKNFRATVTKPDNVPITIMVLSVMIFIWLAFRRAALNDGRASAGLPFLEEERDDKVLVWPDLVYTELICLILATAALTIWAIVAKAPLEQPANPAAAPNPAKAPWYFLGLQEMLVYFDPWIAGVVFPGLIIGGLMSIPYIDTNPKGNGYFTFAQRPFAIAVFLFGFLILWVVLIFFGTFLRGPNWNFYGLYESWDPHKTVALTNIDISNIWWTYICHRARPTASDNPIPWLPVWLVREWLGLVLVGGYFLILPALLRATVFKRMYQNMGAVRYSIMVILLLFMALMPIKMVLRWLFNMKYFIYLPEFSANL